MTVFFRIFIEMMCPLESLLTLLGVRIVTARILVLFCRHARRPEISRDPPELLSVAPGHDVRLFHSPNILLCNHIFQNPLMAAIALIVATSRYCLPFPAVVKVGHAHAGAENLTILCNYIKHEIVSNLSKRLSIESKTARILCIRHNSG